MGTDIRGVIAAGLFTLALIVLAPQLVRWHWPRASADQQRRWIVAYRMWPVMFVASGVLEWRFDWLAGRAVPAAFMVYLGVIVLVLWLNREVDTSGDQ